MLYRTSPPPPATSHVTGQYLAKNKLPARGRAKIAADILARKTVVVDLTATQLARICRVSLGYVHEARGRSPQAKRLLREWNAADHGTRVEFARAIGPDRVFDVVTEAIG